MISKRQYMRRVAIVTMLQSALGAAVVVGLWWFMKYGVWYLGDLI